MDRASTKWNKENKALIFHFTRLGILRLLWMTYKLDKPEKYAYTASKHFERQSDHRQREMETPLLEFYFISTTQVWGFGGF